jgi:hypothetical protein
MYGCSALIGKISASPCLGHCNTESSVTTTSEPRVLKARSVLKRRILTRRGKEGSCGKLRGLNYIRRQLTASRSGHPIAH